MKRVYLFLTTAIFYINPIFADSKKSESIPILKSLENMEKNLNGKIGVYAIDTNSDLTVAFNEDERFPVQSTMKLMIVGALLKQSVTHSNLLKEKVFYTKNDLEPWWSPVTKINVGKGMTLEALAESAMTYSDNTAANLIMKKFGGPKFATNFANSIGNSSFNVAHYEGDLNSDPKNRQDTSTPKDMAMSLQKLTLGSVLPENQRQELVTWMKNNTTSYHRMRAGVPMGWLVADKTGSGDFGIANDIGIAWSASCKPIILSIYTVRNEKDAKQRDDIIATTTQLILNEFAGHDSCF